ncbi:MAG TPA: hypothetical protein VHJ78_04790 [Actinomycetota bacterium]|nr:hypothetical protein [Actinomycetota bacterium]
MADPIPIYLETGSKRTFACSVEWPGWCRSGKTDQAAVEALLEAAPRYAEVARAAHKRFPKVDADRLEVVERIPGNGTTDFGAPAKAAKADLEPLDRSGVTRLTDLLSAAWEHLDQVVAGAPAELRKGPRGGGRDRDEVYRHVLAAETAYARSIGVKLGEPSVGDKAAIAGFRKALVDSIQEAAGKPPRGKGWPIPYAVRRMAWHVLDHAWEIQDKS